MFFAAVAAATGPFRRSSWGSGQQLVSAVPASVVPEVTSTGDGSAVLKRVTDVDFDACTLAINTLNQNMAVSFHFSLPQKW